MSGTPVICTTTKDGQIYVSGPGGTPGWCPQLGFTSCPAGSTPSTDGRTLAELLAQDQIDRANIYGPCVAAGRTWGPPATGTGCPQCGTWWTRTHTAVVVGLAVLVLIVIMLIAAAARKRKNAAAATPVPATTATPPASTTATTPKV